MLRLLKNELAVIFFLAVGLYFAWTSVSELDLGSMRRMGSGFFPFAVGLLLCGLAVVQFVSDLKARPKAEDIDINAIWPVVLAVAAFCLLTPLAGLLPAVFSSVLLACFAVGRMSWVYRILLAVGVAMLTWLIFIVALRLPLVAFQGG